MENCNTSSLCNISSLSRLTKGKCYEAIYPLSFHSSDSFDTSVQFLHIHIYRLFFVESVSPSSPETVNLLLTLLNFEHSVEFNKLGLSALDSIVSTIISQTGVTGLMTPY